MRIETVTQPSGLSNFVDEWTDLVSAAGDATVFDTPEWVTNWLDCFWGGRDIHFVFLFKDRSMVGVAPFVVDEEGDLWCSSSLVAPVNNHSTRTSVVCASKSDEVFHALLAHLQQRLGTFRLAFPILIDRGPVPRLMPDIAAQHGISLYTFETDPSLILRINGDWDEYLASRSHHAVKEWRRKIKRFEKSGHVERVTVTTLAQCQGRMNDVFRIEENSWKEEGGSSFTADLTLKRFYGTFAERAAQAGWLRLYVLYLDSQPVAHIYGVVFRNQYYALKTSYDLAYRDLSPGVVLFCHALKDAFEQKLDLFDFLGTGSRWKSEFSNDTIVQASVCAVPNSLLCSTCNNYHNHLKPFVRERMPLVLKAKRWVQRALHK